jgi:riboflavin kinase/FMN adenylyltransferase
VDNVVVAPFSVEFSQIPAIEYVKDFLVGNFHPSVITIGYDHRFGRNRSGGIELLKEYAPVFNYEVEEISAEMINNMTISSTKIRKAIEAGEVDNARALLGHYFYLRGYVTKGQQVGHQLGFPTANIELTVDYKIAPKTGVYAAWAKYKDKRYPAMMNIGYRPTFEGSDKTIEVHIIGFDQDIYGEELQVDFVEMIREESKFDGPEALKAQLNKDKAAAERILAGDKPN